MSYLPISIKEVMEKINFPSNGWYLPQVQRQYVWGQRGESEAYICLLMDSLFRGYPIGGIVVWETSQSVPFREFIGDYYEGQRALLVHNSRWASNKCLVYDGQQRLQTLRSVLYHTFNGRVLCFNLLFDKDSAKNEPDDTGFRFIDKDKSLPEYFVYMSELGGMSSGDQKQKVVLENRYLKKRPLTSDEEILVRANLGTLWNIFVDKEKKTIAYYLVQTNNSDEVNEIFRRLNIGGIALTEVELVLSKIKSEYFDFEEKLWNLSQKIKQITFGFHFSCHEILQVLYLLYFQTTKVEESRLKKSDYKEFNSLLSSVSCVIEEFFRDFLWGQFKINSETIVCRKQALLPIIVYLNSLRVADKPFRLKKLSSKNLFKINQYFLFSQFCDWNTQTMVNKFSVESKTAGEGGHEFPFEKIKDIAHEKFRSTSISYEQFISLPFFALKILAHDRAYQFIESTPQIDHIFPVALADQSEQYCEDIDVLWNYQPLPASINNYKRARHPKEFFNSSEGRKFYSDYDFLPSLDSKTWDKYKLFLFHRQKRMRKHLFSRFGIKLKRLKNENK